MLVSLKAGPEKRAALQLVEDLRALADKLDGVGAGLDTLPHLARAVRRISRLLEKPMRLAILGESNSGKSSIANLILGEVTLPALAVANTRLPTLLHYSNSPRVDARTADGNTITIRSGMEVPLSQIFRLEAALPAESLDIVQIVDFPGTSDPIHQVDLTTLGQHKIDALLWATIATQAWRESERRAWLSLPQKLRSRGILVVTHMDLIQTAQDQERLKQRLQAVAQDYFKGVCFISAGKALKAGNIEMASGLFVELNKLAASFEMERLQKAVELSRKLGSYGLLRLAQDTVPQ